MKVTDWMKGALLLTVMAGGSALAQGTLELGLRAGGTATHGFTVIPPQSVTGGVQTPEVRNRSNGIGYGYTAGIWARKHFNSFYLQLEVDYNTFLLKQKATVDRIDVSALSAFGTTLPLPVPAGLVFATLNLVSESSLNSIHVPILIGKEWQDGRIRLYAGPHLLFVQKARSERNVKGQLLPGSPVNIPEQFRTLERTDEVDLLNEEEAGILEVKPFTIAAEVGVGVTLLKKVELDLRYALPVGGVYNDKGITGFLGIASLSVGYKLVSR